MTLPRIGLTGTKSAHVLTALALAAVAALFVLRPFVPSLPADGLDSSWVATLGELADRGAIWGRDVAFTYGPASSIVTRYLDGAYYTRSVPIDLALSEAFGAAAAFLLFASGKGGPAPIVAALIVALVLCAQGAVPDGFLIALPFALMMVALRGGRGAATVAGLGAFTVGLAAWSKTTFPLAALSLFVMGDAVVLSLRRRPPLTLPMLAGAGAGIAVYGIHAADLPRYVALQGEVVAGYAAAMGQPGPAFDVGLFLAAVAVLIGMLSRGMKGREGVAVALGFAVASFFLFKAGFVRHDTHSLIAWRGLALLAVLLAAGWLKHGTGLTASVIALLVVYLYAPAFGLHGMGEAWGPRAILRTDTSMLLDGVGEAAAALHLARGPARAITERRAAKARAWSDMAAAKPLGSLPGSVDILPSEGTRVMANGLDYRPRPSFAEYSTYTEALAAANRAFLDGAEAPRWFLFGPEADGPSMSIDGRFPNFAEGSLWLDLLSRYRPDHRIGPLLALERRAEPVTLPLGPPHTAEVALGAEVQVGGDGAIWAQIDVRPSPLGRVVATLYRPPLLEMAVTFADGGERRFRFVPALGRAGFLLSPLIGNASDFALLAAGRDAAPDRRVVGMRVLASPAGAAFYAPEMRVTSRSVDVSALRDAAVPASSGSAWDRLAAAVPPSMIEDGDRVAATAPTTLAVPAEALARVTLAYGVEDAAWQGERTTGACFSLRSVDGVGGPLWQACLDPDAVPSDRGPHVLNVEVPQGATELELKTSCRGSCDAAWSYWERLPDSTPTSR